MIFKLLTERHLEFLSLKGGCRGLSESTHVKMPHCWKSHATAHFYFTGNFSVKDMMKILRDVDSGICMADKTKGSQVSVLSPGASASPCCHWLTGTRNPSTSLFKPFIFGPNPDIGKITMSPDYGENDPRKIIPRFQKKVDRGHELYKGHEKLVEVLGRDDPMGHMVLENMRELENNCIADMEEILSSYTEESFRKVAGMFKHMCDIEMNFYKMLPSGELSWLCSVISL